MKEFTEKFGTYSNTALLKIINSPEQYQPAAVEAAKNILAAREVSRADMEIERTRLEAQRQEKEAATQRRQDLELKIKSVGASIVENINPIQKRASTDAKIVNIISVLFGLLSLHCLYQLYDMIQYMSRDVHAKWDLDTLLYSLPFLIIPPATLFFYLRKKIGWTFLSIYLSHSAALAIGLVIHKLTRQPSGFAALDSIFPSTSVASEIIAVLLLVITLWTICRKGILDIFNVSYKFLAVTLGSSVLISALIIYSLFF